MPAVKAKKVIHTFLPSEAMLMCSKACPKCNKNVLNLKRHLLIHLDYSERPYRCPWEGCTVATTQAAGLEIHINTIHTGLKPHLCPEDDCDFATGDTSKLCNHRKREHKYVPGQRNNRKKRVTKAEEASDENALEESPFVRSSPGVNSMRKAGRGFVNKGGEELPIAALPFPFSKISPPTFTPVVYEQAQVRAQHPMTVNCLFPVSWAIPAQAPIMQACGDRLIEGPGCYAPCQNYAPAVYPRDAVYPNFQFPRAVVPRAFAGGPLATVNNDLEGWSTPKAAGYVNCGYTEARAGVGGGDISLYPLNSSLYAL
ncbi:hypothetical protein DFS33DRAFT_1454575 [Desarmillaria ectypa]|nr:hypothetical protein DFS33DRAFT_1454575 [Desarmillaria ectypa]